MLTRRLALSAAFLLGSGGVWLLSRPLRGEAIDIDVMAATLGERQGVKIGFGDPTGFFVPPYLAADAPVQGVAFQPVERDAVADSLKGIAKAFDAYPEKCLGRIIKAIFIAGKITIDGAEAGGTYGLDWVFLAAPKNVSPETRALTAELGVHHETSSFLWIRNPKLQRDFTALAPAGWRFQDTAADEISRNGNSAPAPETGFLSAYGATTAENDFNTYAEILFSDPDRMKKLAEATPLVAKKLALVAAAYVAADARLDEQFRKSGLSKIGMR